LGSGVRVRAAGTALFRPLAHSLGNLSTYTVRGSPREPRPEPGRESDFHAGGGREVGTPLRLGLPDHDVQPEALRRRLGVPAELQAATA
jgi:hypothetical protein